MKKWICVLGVLCLFSCVSVSVCAADNEMVQDFSEELDSLIQSFPEEMKKEIGDSEANSDGLASITEQMNLGFFLQSADNALQTVWPSALGLLCRILGMLILLSLYSGMKSALQPKSMMDALDFCCMLCVALSLSDSVRILLHHCVEYLNGLTSLVNGVTAISCTVCIASGQISLASVGNASLLLLYSLFENISTVILIPIVQITFCLSVVGSVSNTVRVDGMNRCIRQVFTWGIGLLTFLISFVIGIQSILAKSADSFSMKTVRFALGSFIPLVGNALSDALGTVAGSLHLIRNTCGILCACAVVVLILPVLIELILHRIVLSVCQGAAAMIGCERESHLIEEINSVCGYMLAVVAIASLLFLFVLTLLTMISGTGG